MAGCLALEESRLLLGVWLTDREKDLARVKWVKHILCTCLPASWNQLAHKKTASKSNHALGCVSFQMMIPSYTNVYLHCLWSFAVIETTQFFDSQICGSKWENMPKSWRKPGQQKIIKHFLAASKWPPLLSGKNKKRFDLDALHGVMCKHHFQVKLPAGNHRITVRLRGKLQTQTPGEAIGSSKTKLWPDGGATGWQTTELYWDILMDPY